VFNVRLLAAMLLLIAGSSLLAGRDGLAYLRVVVTNKEGTGLVTGLTRDRFQITEGRQVKPIEEFNADRQLASVIIVLDLSGSMFNLFQVPNRFGDTKTSSEAVERVQRTIDELARLGQQAGESCLLTFGDDVLVLKDFGESKAPSARLPVERILHGRTRATDALLFAAEKLERRAAFSRRLIILISDGEENSSIYSKGEIRRRLLQSGARLSNIVFDDRDMMDRGYTFGSLASATGGTTLKLPVVFDTGPQLAALKEGVRVFLSEQEHEYTLGYRSSLDSLEDLSKMKVSVPGTEYKTRITLVPKTAATP